MTLDENAFSAALAKATDENKSREGIGTLSEKTLHSFLKHYLQPDESFHEIKVGRFVADILKDGRITEILTRSFNTMRKKLEYFLEEGYDVTIVHPMAGIKKLCWIDGETGDVSKTRKSPKKMSIHDSFYELYKIKSFLLHERLHFRFIFLELTEYRNLDGWSHDKKKGSSRFDRIPSGILNETVIETPVDYKKVLPANLPQEFTSKDYAVCAGVNLKRARTALNVLKYVGAVKEASKNKNSIIYMKNE